MDVCDDLTGVVLGAQEPPDQFVEAKPFWTGYLDHSVHRRPERDFGQRSSNVIRYDGLNMGTRQANRLSVGGRLSDAVNELEELRRANDCVGDLGSLDEALLLYLRTENPLWRRRSVPTTESAT